MRLYLVRHALAGQHGDPHYPDDSLRPLTKKGRKQFSRLIRVIADQGFQPEAIGTSPYVRSLQTAEIIVDRLKPHLPVQVVDAFAPGCRLTDVMEWIKTTGAEQLAYVGHAPDIDLIAAGLLDAGEGTFRFAKGAVAAIDLDNESSPAVGTLRWLVTPKLLR